MTTTSTRVWVCLAALLSCLWLACGDDSGGGKGNGDDAPKGEPCLQPGATQTGCSCLNGGVGSRHCTQDKVWTECACARPLEPSECEFDGQKVVCHPSGSCAEEWEVECRSNTFDCTCPADQGGGGASGDGGSGGGSAGNAGNSAGNGGNGGANAGRGGGTPDAGMGEGDAG